MTFGHLCVMVSMASSVLRCEQDATNALKQAMLQSLDMNQKAVRHTYVKQLLQFRVVDLTAML